MTNEELETLLIYSGAITPWICEPKVNREDFPDEETPNPDEIAIEEMDRYYSGEWEE